MRLKFKNEQSDMFIIDRQFPDYKAYDTPVLFQSDWLNEFWDQWTDMNDDYRFVYMGPKGTWCVSNFLMNNGLDLIR